MRLRWGLLLIPAAVFFGLFFLLPQLSFVASGFRPDLGYGRLGSGVTLANFQRFLADDFYWVVLWNTIKISLYTTAGSLVVGFPAAYVLARSHRRVTRILVPVLLLSTFISLVIRALGWLILLSPGGMVNQTLLALRVPGAPFEFLNHPLGVILGMVHYVLPLMILSLMNVIQTISPALENAAASLGANRLRIYTRVILPLSLPGIVAASLVVFSMTMGVFATPLLLGGGRVYVLPILIYQEIMVKTRYAVAAAMSLVLLVLTLAVNMLSLAVVGHYQSRGRAST